MSKRREAKARLYDPALGRFLSPDPYVQMPDFSQNFNRYSYCLNNPLIYVDESGEFFWIIPNISWSKHGGFSIGISFVFGIPGGASLQAGIGYNFKSGDVNAFMGATLMMNTAYINMSSSSGVSIGYTAGLSSFSGIPIGTNFATVGVNYNLSNNSISGNLSAWTFDKSGFTFDPSVSAMIFPEHTTNLIRGQGFRTNNQVLRHFVDSNQHQKALDYFGFEGKYDPTNPLFGGGKEPAITHSRTGDIYYSDYAFDGGFDKLYFVADHEMRHRSNVLSGKYNNIKITEEIHAREEYETYVYNYKQQGRYLNHSFNLENRINIYASSAGLDPNIYLPYCFPNMRPFWHFIYKIPRKW